MINKKALREISST